MKKNILRLATAAIIAVSAVVPSSMAFAEYNPDKVINENEPSTKNISVENAVFIDNEILDGAELVFSEDVPMFPARKVFEALGYTVEWKGETRTVIISYLPRYITFSIDIDGYTIAKTAPMKLNKAPELINGITYVPVNILSELLEMDINDFEENVPYNLYITTEQENADDTISDEVGSDGAVSDGGNIDEEVSTEVSSEDEISTETGSEEKNVKVISLENDLILVDDAEKGEVALAVGDDTVIVFDDGENAELSDIKEDAELYVEYGEEMTMSIPPINNPVKIVIFK